MWKKTEPYPPLPKDVRRRTSLFANEAIYKIYIDVAGILWASGMAVMYYFLSGSPSWIRISVSCSLLISAMVTVSSMLVKKAGTKSHVAVSLKRSFGLIVCEFAWKMASMGLLALAPILAIDLMGPNPPKLVHQEPSILVAAIVHLVIIVVVIRMMHIYSKRERISESSLK
jgi:hypothetical protein